MRYIFILLLILISIFFYVLLKPVNQLPSETIPFPSPSISNSPSHAVSLTGLFVPYWTVDASLINERYDELYYFGVAPTFEGTILSDVGDNNFSSFLNLVRESNSKKFLVIRMLDRDISNELLQNTAKQNRFIQETTNLARNTRIDGIVLDFEYNALSFDTTVDRITNLYQNYSKVVKEEQLQFYVTLYGDTFYRLRPYDVEKIGNASDRVLIMAYDFHKSRGDSGPTFPLFGKEKYGYDMSSMIDDFSLSVPKEKLTIVFGMFGYDWVTGGASARAVTTTQGISRFLNGCNFLACHITVDAPSAETQVEYTGEDGKKHTVWFETSASIEKKQQYLKDRGISSFGYWAYSYF